MNNNLEHIQIIEYIDIIELCIQEDGMTWIEAIKEYRQISGWTLRECSFLAKKWENLQHNTKIANNVYGRTFR